MMNDSVTPAGAGNGRAAIVRMAASNTLGFAAGPIMPLIVGAVMADFALSEAAVGLVVSFQLGAMALAALTVSFRADRLDLRQTVLAGLVLALAGNAISASTDQLAILYVSRAIAGLGEGALVACANAAVSGYSRPERLFAVLGVTIGVFAAMLLLGMPKLIGAFGAAGAFGTLACVDILLAPLLLWFPRSGGAPGARPAGDRKPIFRGAGLAVLLGIGIFSIGMGVVQTFLERIGVGAGLSVQSIGSVLALGSGIGIFTPMLVILLGTRFGSTAPIVIASVLAAVIILFVTGSGSATLYLYLIPAFHPTILFLAPYQLGLMAFLDPSGRVAAAAPAFITFGAAIGPAIGGFVLGGFGVPALGWVAIVAFLIGTVLFLRTARRSDAIRGGRS